MSIGLVIFYLLVAFGLGFGTSHSINASKLKKEEDEKAEIHKLSYISYLEKYQKVESLISTIKTMKDKMVIRGMILDLALIYPEFSETTKQLELIESKKKYYHGGRPSKKNHKRLKKV
jgi:hypothetical protein